MSAEKTILVTGFEPFGHHVINPSWEVMKTLDGSTIAGHRVTSHLLPVVYSE
jgi:pyroglutamyl-peptidase